MGPSPKSTLVYLGHFCPTSLIEITLGRLDNEKQLARDIHKDKRKVLKAVRFAWALLAWGVGSGTKSELPANVFRIFANFPVRTMKISIKNSDHLAIGGSNVLVASWELPKTWRPRPSKLDFHSSNHTRSKSKSDFMFPAEGGGPFQTALCDAQLLCLYFSNVLQGDPKWGGGGGQEETFCLPFSLCSTTCRSSILAGAMRSGWNTPLNFISGPKR